MEPLDTDFNAAILMIAADLFPDGFDVSTDAPGTYKALKADLDAGKRLVVYDGGVKARSYVYPIVNHAFRAWYDFTHWKGGYDFSVGASAASSRCNGGISSTSTATPWKPGDGSGSSGRRSWASASFTNATSASSGTTCLGVNIGRRSRVNVASRLTPMTKQHVVGRLFTANRSAGTFPSLLSAGVPATFFYNIRIAWIAQSSSSGHGHARRGSTRTASFRVE